jgi:hypothetical protein
MAEKYAFTTREAAAFLGLDESRIRALCNSGMFGFKVMNVGGRTQSQKWTILRDDLIRWANQEQAAYERREFR